MSGKEIEVITPNKMQPIESGASLTMDDILAYRLAKFEQTLISDQKSKEKDIGKIREELFDIENKYHNEKKRVSNKKEKELSNNFNKDLRSIGVKVPSKELYSVSRLFETNNKYMLYEVYLQNELDRNITVKQYKAGIPKKLLSLRKRWQEYREKYDALQSDIYEIKKKLMNIDVEERRARGTVVAMKLSKSEEGRQIMKQLDNL